MAEEKALTAADVAAKLKGYKVRIPVLEDGEIKRGEDGKIVTRLRAPKAEDIVSFAVRGGVITAVTVDGQKLTAK